VRDRNGHGLRMRTVAEKIKEPVSMVDGYTARRNMIPWS
jgi:hypothetical protein